MPELPEVESVARALRPFVVGKMIRNCKVRDAIAVWPQSSRYLRARTAGRRIEDVSRFGKYLVLDLDRGCVVMHFRLDGQLFWFGKNETARRVNVVFELNDGALGFVDQRRFGRVHWYESPQACPGIASLGLDPFSAEFTVECFRELLARSRRPLKLLLLDQHRIAGLGNIYASESLWRARLNPRRAANRVNRAEAARLHAAIVSVLRAAIECCSNPPPDFRNPEWWFQGLKRILGVYDREGAPCHRCKGRIRRIEQGGRSTYYCPKCQR